MINETDAKQPAVGWSSGRNYRSIAREQFLITRARLFARPAVISVQQNDHAGVCSATQIFAFLIRVLEKP